MSEDVKSHIAIYLRVGGALLVLTVVTVLAWYMPTVYGTSAAIPLAVTIALIIAATKASLVASYFMHLIDERREIYVGLLVTALLFLVLMFIPLLGLADKVGEHMTLPNANAPADEAH